MKELERKLSIRYRWWRSGGGDIRPEHVDALDERARDRIFEMAGKDFVAGELCDNIRFDDSDGDDGVEYRGYWRLEEKN